MAAYHTALRRTVAAACAGLLAIALMSCVHNPPDVGGKPSAPRSPETFWDPPKHAITRDSIPKLALPPDIAERVKNLTLPDVLDIGLANNPLTRQSYALARAAGAGIGAAYGKYLPQVTVGATAERESFASAFAASSGTSSAGVRESGSNSLFLPNASASWLLFDFGETSSFEVAKQAAFAASYSHNATLQGVVDSLEQAYFSYNAARATLSADSITAKEDSTNLAAAVAEHTAGIATISDVLQAQTTLSQQTLQIETDAGSVQITRGSLAVAMGFPATLPYDIVAEPPNVPIEGISASVDSLVTVAVNSRPDLASYRAQLAEARANVGVVRGQGLPSLTFNGSESYTYANPSTLNGNSYTLSAGLSFPIFQGFQNAYNILQAREQAKAQAANAEFQRDVVVDQVFTSYYNLRTATARVKSTDDLLHSAQANYDVASGKYKQGVGSILDLLTAQAALASARSQEAQARWIWYSDLAQLSHDVGVIGLHGEMGIPLHADSNGVTPR